MREICSGFPEELLTEILEYGQTGSSFMEEIELLDGASAEFDQDLVDRRENCPRYSSVPL